MTTTEFFKQRLHGNVLFGIALILFMGACFESADPGLSRYLVLCFGGPTAAAVIAGLLNWGEGEGHEPGYKSNREEIATGFGGAIAALVMVILWNVVKVERFNFFILLAAVGSGLWFFNIWGGVQGLKKLFTKKKK
jgi:hypothetical protein